jgi:hypothetical protein
MQTYLDEYANRAINEYREARFQYPKEFKAKYAAMLRLGCEHRAFAFYFKCIGAQIMLQKEREAELCHYFQAMLLPFASMKTDDQPLALSLDAHSVADFRGAGISAEIRNFGRKTAAENGMVYLDFPNRSFSLGNNCYLRALFIDTKAPISFWSVFENPVTRGSARMSWAEGEDNLLSADGETNGTKQLRGLGIDVPAMLREIEDFAWLALTHHEIEREKGAEMVRLPYLAGTDARRSGRKARQVAKKFSLFSVVNVSTRSIDRDRSGEPSGNSDGSIRRGHPVRGHFKMQAYGPKWSQHRLIWVESYDKPGNGEETSPIPLHLVRTANRLAA